MLPSESVEVDAKVTECPLGPFVIEKSAVGTTLATVVILNDLV